VSSDEGDVLPIFHKSLLLPDSDTGDKIGEEYVFRNFDDDEKFDIEKDLSDKFSLSKDIFATAENKKKPIFTKELNNSKNLNFKFREDTIKTKSFVSSNETFQQLYSFNESQNGAKTVSKAVSTSTSTTTDNEQNYLNLSPSSSLQEFTEINSDRKLVDGVTSQDSERLLVAGGKKRTTATGTTSAALQVPEMNLDHLKLGTEGFEFI
jgi:hypothetical protein